MNNTGMNESSQGRGATVTTAGDVTQSSSVQMNNVNVSSPPNGVMMSVSEGVVSSASGTVLTNHSSDVSMSNGINVSSSGMTVSSSNLFGKSSVKAPTCKVCGDESSGFHYGVDSCEGCKGFFRRCITQGMTHKCSNEEKCEITPFTRNSCQYCRLKKCFAVGMSREASRLGRRPKRLKDSTGESRHHHTANLPIAPYPTNTSDLQKLRMAELQRVLQQNGTFKADLMQAFLEAAQVSFREHQRNHNTSSNSNQQSNNIDESVKLAGASNMVNGVNSTSENRLRVQGNESGYSSLSSPSSSKSQSPVTSENAHVNNDNSLSDNMLIDNKKLLLSNKNNVTTANYAAHQQQANIEEIEKVAMNIKAEPGTNLSRCSLSDHSNMGNIEISTEFLTSLTDKMFTDANFMSNIEQFIPTEPKVEPESPSSSSSNMQVSGDSVNPDSNEESMDDAEMHVDVEKVLSEVKNAPSELRKTLIEQVTESVVEAHFNTCNPTYQAVAAANQHYMEMIQSNEMPDFSKLIIEPNTVWQQFTKAMVPEITLVVKFCKKIPGFAEIEQDDQINLIKQGSFEVMLCRFCNLVDTVKGEMMDPTMKFKCPRDVVKKMPMGNFLEEFFKVAERFNPLKLTDGEIGLFTSVLIICPERSGLVSVRAVRKLQSLLYQSFYLLVKRNHYDYDNIFIKVLGMISVFRKINKKHQAALSNMKMSMPEATSMFPALHQEMFADGT